METPVATVPRGKSRRTLRILLIALASYLLVAYLFAPTVWKLITRNRPQLTDTPRLTVTSDGHPGDPLNVALVGSVEQLEAAFKSAGWQRAARLGLESDLKIAADTVLSRPDTNAPVSNLFLFNRAEDFAFERAVGDSPRQRHHVRFWKLADPSPDGRPAWIGSASFDKAVGLSHTTGQITHHIDGHVDQERDFLFDTLTAANELNDDWLQAGYQPQHSGRNGGGDEWTTDGDLRWGSLSANSRSAVPKK